MNNLLKDFKIQPTKLRGENMEKEIQILTRYEDPTIKQLQQELTNLKAIEKEHQRMNGELREEIKELKKSNGINDWQRQVNLKNYMDTIHIIDELEKWLNDLGNWVVLEKLQELKGESNE